MHDDIPSDASCRNLRSDVLRFDDKTIEKLGPYQYKALPPSKKRIRLLQLQAGTIHSPAIYCKLIDADYDNPFHIPTRATDDKRDEDAYGEASIKTLEGDTKRLEAVAKRVKENQIKYQALSWCWGTDPPEYAVIITEGKRSYRKRVRKDLAAALKYLRRSNRIRTLWIDAICINQDDPEERNQQVQMMSRIYTRAEKVCIWLGEDGDESKLAIDFIREEIAQLRDFDAISSDKNYSNKWRALMMLMQREWFSRRWVVQEISLAKKAKIYCGPYSIPWKEFAVAVELFVEVETATHRLSEVMQKDEKFRHVPGWFEYVSELGASLLVHATGKVFRAHGTPMDDDHNDPLDFDDFAEYVQKVHTIDPLDRRSLLSLEYLVTTMFIFRATESRDSIYSMLAIARDAAPFAERGNQSDKVFLTMTLFECFLAEKPFIVDYSRPYSDVCRDFVEFCIKRKSILDPIQALDILCRPWALEPKRGNSIRLTAGENASSSQTIARERLVPKHLGGWKRRLCKIHVDKRRATWMLEKRDRDCWVEDERTTEEYVADNKKPKDRSWTVSGRVWTRPKDWVKVKALVEGYKEDLNQGFVSDVDLPCWVARATNAPFSLYSHPGIYIRKAGRANADPLVGPPQDGHRNYKAAQTEAVRMEHLKFRKRPYMRHYSLYVAGFELDEVARVTDASQGGNIPRSWLDLSGWETPYEKDPPAEFWRTIVADRGQDNQNPPYYYARACKESVNKGGIASGMVNTTALINNERNSIIAEFCRRVHAVIWHRSLFRTKKQKLGIAAKGVEPGDKICILYGCTVPVILSERRKTMSERQEEVFEDQFEAFRSCMRRLEKICIRKARYRDKRGQHDGWEEAVIKVTANVNETLDTSKKLRQDIERQAEDGLKTMRIKATTRSLTKSSGSSWLRFLELAVSLFWTIFLFRRSPLLYKEVKNNSDGNNEPCSDEYLYYVFKGESYVHGCMDGEALRAKFYEDTKERVFELR